MVGNGTPASCTAAGVVSAVRRGGLVRFDCGPGRVTIAMTATAEVLNTSRTVVVDGGGKVTLDGLGQRRIIRQDTCDQALGWTTDHCDDQQFPRLVLRDLVLRRGAVDGDLDTGSGGAVFVRGGQLRIERTAFRDNRCAASGPDTGGAAVRVLDQWQDRPVRVMGSSFVRGSCSNGGALSSIGVSWDIHGSRFRDNVATGSGANPARPGTAGGGSGAAIYVDGDTFDVAVRRSVLTGNHATEGGGAIFFVSNDRTGHLSIAGSTLRRNPSDGFETDPGIFYLGRQPHPSVLHTVLR